MLKFEVWQPPQPALFLELQRSRLADDEALLKEYVPLSELTSQQEAAAQKLGRHWLSHLRDDEKSLSTFDALMRQYDLSCTEGILLMCIAEALLRIPDQKTVDLLLSDKLSAARWRDYLGKSHSLQVNLSTWGLFLGGEMMGQPEHHPHTFKHYSQALFKRVGAPAIRRVVKSMMSELARKFILGTNMPDALKHATRLQKENPSQTFSFDMLGEAARNDEDALRYYNDYVGGLTELAANVGPLKTAAAPLSLSIKLSAIYPRYETSQRQRCVPVLVERVLKLAISARHAGIQLTIDAEECDRLELSLEVFYKVFSNDELASWNGFGLALQCYQKSCLPQLQWLIAVAEDAGKKIPLRLVKGAYWDSEIKLAQEEGLQQYPVFSRKCVVDLTYIVCAKKMLASPDAIIPQFATHNVHTAAVVLACAGEGEVLEFQHLRGMGEGLCDLLHADFPGRILTRMYAPVGVHHDLLPYLVRRLLENGANSSFVAQMHHDHVEDDDLLQHPAAKLQKFSSPRHDKIPLPADLYAPRRKNSAGLNLNEPHEIHQLQLHMRQLENMAWHFASMQKKHALLKNCFLEKEVSSFNPAAKNEVVGHCLAFDEQKLPALMMELKNGHASWSRLSVDDRAQCLERLADLLEAHRPELMWLMNQEAGRVFVDTLSELREAVDFCRYYACCAREYLAPKILPGPTGEDNTLHCIGRGTVACISPWNFPLAIFIGQVSAALVAGNTVLAKPASLTPLCAARVVELAYLAGIPKQALQLVVCSGAAIDEYVLRHQALSAVMLTGSNATADAIVSTLSQRGGTILPFVAETGGINAMIADSTAFPEHVVDDVVQSAFGSAGQRCSSLRVLCIQEDIAEKVIHMLKGAMATLRVADPQCLATDVGPLIDGKAQAGALDYLAELKKQAEDDPQAVQFIYASEAAAQEKSAAELSKDSLAEGYYVPPHAFEIASLKQVTKEVFAPILHVYRYKKSELDEVIAAINAWGFGLTCGIHSRIDYQIEYIQQSIAAGNVYVNRNMIGAVVGTQPFGGQGLSGTGPKAGGPHYLLRLVHEKTICNNTAAVGGNASLLALGDGDQVDDANDHQSEDGACDQSKVQ